MAIEEVDFRITSTTGHFWDLELLYTVRPKGKPERQEFKDAGYGMLLQSCIERIIGHRLSQKEEVYTLKGYLKDYKKEIDRLATLLNSDTVENIVTESKLAKSIKS